MKRILLPFIIGLFSIGILPLQVFAQTYYWIGGSGNWNDRSHWSLASGGVQIGAADPLPGASTDVVFDAGSPDPVVNDYTVTINAPGAVCRNMNWVAIPEAINPVLTGAAGWTVDIYGSLDITAVITNNFEGTFRFLAPNTQTIKANTPFHPQSTLLFNNATGKWVLGGGLSANNIWVQNGDLDVSTNNYSINVRGNWLVNANATFTSQGGTVIFSGTSTTNPQIINTSPSSANREFFNVIIDNIGAGIVLNSPIMIGKNNDGRITFSNGVVTTTLTNILNINYRAEVSGANDDSHVNGYVRKFGSDTDDEFYFPIGNGSYYRPAGLKFQNSNPNAQFVAKYTRRAPGDVNYPATNVQSPLTVSQFEYWEIERTGGNASTRVILTWEIPISGPENYLGDPASADGLIVASWNSDNPLTGQWVERNSTQQTVTNPNPANYAGHTRMQSAMANTDRRVWTLGSRVIPLPIELLYFKANLVNGIVHLDWATASEKDNDYFTIEKSTDSKHFEVLLEVDAAGNSQQVQTYHAIDPNPVSPLTYYRLKQTDTDGKFTYSKIVAIHSGNKASLSAISLLDKQVRLTYYLPESKEAMLSLYDTKGVLLWNKLVSGDSNLQAETLQFSYPSGMYLLTMQLDGETTVKKIFVR